MTTAQQMEPDDFRLLDHFRLLTCLGEGGMGQVWAAHDTSSTSGRIVAVKTTKQHGVEAARILWDEARIASMIEHPNVCRVHELGKAGETQYLVMDWCDGSSLYDLLQAVPTRTLPYPVAAKIVGFAAAGLHAAHQLTDEDGQLLGVVHRDVSPQNILISTRGVVTMTDFGVAKALGQAHKATATGEVKGKLSYMAPEQVTRKNIDHRADVFALGSVLYLAATGTRPFHGGDALTTLYQILEEDIPPPTSIRPDLPKELEQLIMKALQKDPGHRFQTAEEMQRALEHWIVGSGTTISERDIGSFLMEHLGEKIRSRNSLLRTQSRRSLELQADLLLSDRTPRTQQHPDEGGTTENPTITEARSPSDREPTPSTTLSSARQDGRHGWSIPTAIALAVGVIGFVGLSALTKSNDQGTPAPSEPAGASELDETTSPKEPNESVPPPDGSDAAPSLVAVAVTVDPSEATIWVDGKPVGQGSYTIETEKSQERHQLRVALEGFNAHEQSITFDRSKDIAIQLSPTPRPPRPVPRTAPRTTPPTPDPGPRRLDSDNPFEN